MFRNILLFVDALAQGDQALEQAIDLAECEHSRLTILVAMHRPSPWAMTSMTAAGIGPLAADLEQEAEDAMRRAVERVPDRLPVTKILTAEPVRTALTAQLDIGRYDLVVLSASAPGTWLGVWRGRLSRFMLRHSEVPVLLVHSNGVSERRAGAAEIDVASGPRRRWLARASGGHPRPSID